MISLSSKTYIVAKKHVITTSNTAMTASKLLRKAKRLNPKRLKPKKRVYYEKKISSKGISKKSVVAPLTTFCRVPNTRRAGMGTNKGMRAHKNTIYTYTQDRCGFSYFYCKRKVLADGRTTVPLDLELCNNKEEEEDEPMEVDDDSENNLQILLSLMEENESL